MNSVFTSTCIILLLWWLILCVNFIGAQESQNTLSNIILSVLMRVFLDKINLQIGRMSKEGYRSHVGGPRSISGRPQ